MRTEREIINKIEYLKGYCTALEDVEMRYEHRVVLKEQIKKLEWVLGVENEQ